MNFTDIFIKRPVFASVLSLIILLVGIRSYIALPIRQFPEIAASVINISTTFLGANPSLMEGFVTTPLENALSGIDGIDYVESESSTGLSSINVYFQLGYDINKAITDVSNAVASVRYILPASIQDPIIAKQDPNAQPTIYIPFLSNTLSPEAVTDFMLRVVQPQLATLPGVSQAPIFGERTYSMRIWLDPQKMSAQNITAADIQNALSNNNVQTAAGRLDNAWQEYDVTAKTDLNTPDQFNNLVIKNINGKLVRLSDVGYAEIGPESNRVTVSINGKDAIVMGIIPQSTANPLTISKEINKVMPSIQQFLPKGLTGYVIWDTSKFIAQSIKEVFKTILEATIFVVIVIFLFLGSFRSVLIPIVTIPLSIIGVCGIMMALGYTINTLTLLAWVLAIGLVVDDSIVVVENIHRHIEAGMNSFDAAITGAREIGFAIIAMTLTLATVYAPIGFMTGLTGSLFREFAFTLAGAVLISGFAALTLSPMMCSQLLHKHIGKPGFAEYIDNLFNHFMLRYKRFLTLTLSRRGFVVTIAGIIFVICYFLYTSLPSELAPNEDQGAVMAVVNAPSNANLNYTINNTQKIEKIFKSVPEMIGYGFINGYGQEIAVNTAFSFLVLQPWDKRHRSADQIIASLFPQFWMLPGVKAFPFNLPALPGNSGFTPVSFVLKTTGSYDQLNAAAQKLISIIQTNNPRLLNADSDLKLDKAEINIDVDRNKAADLGIPMSDINTTLNIALAEPDASQFNMSGRSYYVIPQLAPQFRQSPDQLGDLNLRTASGDLVPLSSIASINQIVEPPSLTHFQQLRAATITASLAPGYTLGEALNYLQTVAKQNLPSSIQYDYSGQSRQFEQATGAMQETFIFAILFIFLVLATQFESFRDPFIVMMTVPLSTAGALTALHLLPGGTINIYTQIGLVTLIGLISKHGILIVEFSNQLQKQGYDKISAVIEAASIRLRPVIMTTCATILGALPLAIASGAGAAARKQLGVVVIGGMAFGTLFTLIVIPTIYSLLAKTKAKKGSI